MACGDVAVVEGISGEDDLDIILPEHPGLVDLLAGCDNGHEYDPFDPQFVTGVSEALCMVAGAGADDAFLELVGG